MFKKKYDFYLAGKMRGVEALNKPMFTLVARLLRERGYTVWSPSEHEGHPDVSFAEYMILDLNAVINDCVGIVLMSGWRESVGANIEAICAFACGKLAVEVVLNEDETDFTLVPLDLDQYKLPYQ